MKLSLERDALIAALSHATRIVIRADRIPILNTVVLKAEGNLLHIRATNLDMVAETTCPAVVEEEGETAVPVGPLSDLARRLRPGSAMVLSDTGAGTPLTAHYGRSSAVLPTLSPETYVTFSVPEDAYEFQLTGSALVQLVGRPSHAANADDQRAYLQGVHLHYVAQGDLLTGVASNGLRMTRARLPAPDGARSAPAVTIPVKAVAEIVKLAEVARDGAVSLKISDKLLSASVPGTLITTKLIEGPWPNYSRVIPDETIRTARVAASDLEGALQRSLIVVGDDKDRTVSCKIVDGILSISARSQKGGRVAEEMEVDGGDGAVFSMSAKYCIDAIGVLGSDAIELGLGEPLSPILMRCPGSDRMVCVVMPILA